MKNKIFRTSKPKGLNRVAKKRLRSHMKEIDLTFNKLHH